jgi:hypothetical protein
MRILLVLVPIVLFGQSMEQTMLFQADVLAKRYAGEIAKAPPPPVVPQTSGALQLASNWFAMDLNKVKTEKNSPLGMLGNECLWELLAEIGIDAVQLKHLKEQNGTVTTLGINPKYGSEGEYAKLASMAMSKNVQLIGSLLGGATGKGADFALALKNVGAYPGLYSLVEIDPKDWALLPNVLPKTFSSNIPWLTLQTLHKRGYVPRDFNPYVKMSDWNATEPIACADGVVRRWIYLRDVEGSPRLDWLHPSFASERIAAGDALQDVYVLGQKILHLEAALPQNAREDLSLTCRKIGAYTVASVKGGIADLREQPSDLIWDHFTPIGALHALIAQDAEALRLTYRRLMQEQIPLKSLVHPMEPFGAASCDWAEFLHAPKKKYRYLEEELTGEALRKRLLREDISRLGGSMDDDRLPVSLWTEACASMLKVQDMEKKREMIQELHVLLAQFFAWQPGVFSLSAEDLIGATPGEEKIDLMQANAKSLYASLPCQLKNPRSFASQIKMILKTRRDAAIHQADLIDVPDTKHRSVLLLRLRMPATRYVALLGINFGKTSAVEKIESAEYANCNAIDLYTQLTENKLFDSSLFELKLEPHSAKLVLFQPKIYP